MLCLAQVGMSVDSKISLRSSKDLQGEPRGVSGGLARGSTC